MQLPTAAGAPGSAAPAGCTRPGRQPRHHNRGGGWRPWIGGPSEGRPARRGSPCGSAAPLPRPGAARSSRRGPLKLPCAPAAARCGLGCAPGRRGRASLAQLPLAFLRRAARCALHAALRRLFLPSAGCRPSSPLRRFAPARFATSASARCGSGGAGNRAAPETGGGAPGAWVPDPLPTPSAVRAGPRARDAPPRGTVRSAGRPPLCGPGQGKGRPPRPYLSPRPRLEPRRLNKSRSASASQRSCLSPPRVSRLSAQVALHLNNCLLLWSVEAGVGKKWLNRNMLVNRGTQVFQDLCSLPPTQAPSVSLLFHSSPHVVSPIPPTSRICKCSWLSSGSGKLGML